MNPDALLPFGYELLWYSAGALTLYVGSEVHIGIGGLLLFGGLVGSLVRNWESEPGSKETEIYD